MNPFNSAWLVLKEQRKQGYYRQAIIPDDRRKPVTKVKTHPDHAYANRFATMALSQSLSDMGEPIEPEIPIEGGKTQQRQMDEVFGRYGKDDYGDDPLNRTKVDAVKYKPLMQLLQLEDLKGPNVGMKDGRLTIFDPAFRTFRGHKVGQYGKPLDFDNYTAHENINAHIQRVPSNELNELTQRVKDYRPQFDVWENTGDLRHWQEGMGDYHALRDTLTYLNSLRQDPQQTKLFQYEGFGKDPQRYTEMMQRLGEQQ